ncbi:mechanosensitive ion channel family protein [Telluribacter sp.]|jgi:small-conductance mechanosensitive channel|uniref:mechanosensitive ion channel family protein n=1 Tax=Telluribacter sp. TaxID=1978767 RepID=UPI002E161C15|nr:mechanosensitive ion channel family protein [Telluribacter sp.]
MDINKAFQLLSDKLYTWAKELIRLLPNIILAALVLVLGLFIARFIKQLALRLIKRVSSHGTVNALFASLIYTIFVGVIIFIALSILNLDKAVTSILAGAGILGLALAFAFQDIAANFVSGIFLSFRHPIRAGDLVKTNDYFGIVLEVNLRDTVLRTLQGQRVIIPNKEVFQNSIENFTTLGRRRMDLTVGVSYGDDLQKVRDITVRAAEKVSVRDPNEEVTLFFEEFGDSSINFSLRIWLNSAAQPTYLQGRHEAIMHIKEAYDQNDIMIPFPIRTLDFGIKGGEKLSEMDVKVLNGTQK